MDRVHYKPLFIYVILFVKLIYIYINIKYNINFLTNTFTHNTHNTLYLAGIHLSMAAADVCDSHVLCVLYQVSECIRVYMYIYI